MNFAPDAGLVVGQRLQSSTPFLLSTAMAVMDEMCKQVQSPDTMLQFGLVILLTFAIRLMCR